MRRLELLVLVSTLLAWSPACLAQLFVGNIADACVKSAMSTGILAALRDKNTPRAEAEAKIAELLANDPNKEFFRTLTSLNAAVVFGFPAISRPLHEQVALARCARFAKNKPTLSQEAVDALMPKVSNCQSSSIEEARKCAFAVIFEADTP